MYTLPDHYSSVRRGASVTTSGQNLNQGAAAGSYAQKETSHADESSRISDAGRHPEDSFPGHAAWLDWPWKLHRIETRGPVKIELYNLTDDPRESRDLAARDPDRVKSLRDPLEAWLSSVVRSLNGKDYG